MAISEITFTPNTNLSDYYGMKTVLETVGFTTANNGALRFGHSGDITRFVISYDQNVFKFGLSSDTTLFDSLISINQFLKSDKLCSLIYKSNSNGDILFGFKLSTSSNVRLFAGSIKAKNALTNNNGYIYYVIDPTTTSSFNPKICVGEYQPTSAYNIDYIGSNQEFKYSDSLMILVTIVIGDYFTEKGYFTRVVRSGMPLSDYTEFDLNNKNYIAGYGGRIAIEI